MKDDESRARRRNPPVLTRALPLHSEPALSIPQSTTVFKTSTKNVKVVLHAHHGWERSQTGVMGGKQWRISIIRKEVKMARDINHWEHDPSGGRAHGVFRDDLEPNPPTPQTQKQPRWRILPCPKSRFCGVFAAEFNNATSGPTLNKFFARRSCLSRPTALYARQLVLVALRPVPTHSLARSLARDVSTIRSYPPAVRAASWTGHPYLRTAL